MSDSPNAVPFINTTEDGQFIVAREAVDYLSSLPGKVAVIAVAGPWRTGKSFLLNQMMRYNGKSEAGGSGFVVGPTVNACTKGIWLWGQPLTLADGTKVVLMDTEGMGSTSRSQSEDINVFSLALLLSSYFVWNSRGVIDGASLEDFGLVVNLTKHIHVRSDTGARVDVDGLAEYFPGFMWVVRDFTLQLEDKGRKISDRQYLENALKPQSGFSSESASKNQIRSLLTTFFRERDCVTLVRPAEEERVLRDLDAQPLTALRPEFVAGLKGLQEKVFGAVRPKILNGRVLDGAMIATLAQTYVNSINSGGVPEINTAWDRVLETQGARALESAIKTYDAMANSCFGLGMVGGQWDVGGLLDQIRVARDPGTVAQQFPLDEEVLLQLHESCVDAAASVLLDEASSWGLDGKSAGAGAASLRQTLAERYATLRIANERASQSLCSRLLVTGDPTRELRRRGSAGRRRSDLTAAPQPAAPPSTKNDEDLRAAEAWSTSFRGTVGTFCAETYAPAAAGPGRWAAFSAYAAGDLAGCAADWGRGLCAAQREACGGLRARLEQTNRLRESVSGKLVAAQVSGRQRAAEIVKAGEDAQKTGQAALGLLEARLEFQKEALDHSQEAAVTIEDMGQAFAAAAGEQLAHAVRHEQDTQRILDIGEAKGGTPTVPNTPHEDNEAAHRRRRSHEDDTRAADEARGQIAATGAELRAIREQMQKQKGQLDQKSRELQNCEEQLVLTRNNFETESSQLGALAREVSDLQQLLRVCKGAISERLLLDVMDDLTHRQMQLLSQA